MASKNNHKPPIALWKPTAQDIYVESDGKLFVCNFERVFNNPGVIPYKRFLINKTSYEKQLDLIARYINYFITHYDYEQELMLAYIRIKFQIDKEKSFQIPELPPDASEEVKNKWEEERNKIINGFIEFVHGELFSEDNHIRDNIIQMVNDNYLDDVEQESDRKKHNDKEYLESLEFTNEHVKIMFEISLAMKMIAPILFHYLYINMVKLEKDSDIVYRFYKPLFSGLFSDHVNIFNKLYVYVKSRVLESNSINAPMFQKREIYGVLTKNMKRHPIERSIENKCLNCWEVFTRQSAA